MDETYYVVANRPRQGSALLAWFDLAGEEPRVHFVRLATRDFEQALLAGWLVPAVKQAMLPPWLVGCEGVDVGTLEARRRSAMKSYTSRAEERYEVIAPLVDRHETIIASSDPYLTIRRIAAEHAPRQKAARIAPWYVCYVIFARSMRALWPAFGGIGVWPRTVATVRDKKLGRPAAAGRLSGHSAIPLSPRIVDSYLKYARLGVTMTAIYCSALVKDFGCLTRRNAKGLHEYYHPQGLPFPSRKQFVYWVHKVLGSSEVRRMKLGDVLYRNQVAVSVGPFSSSVSNVLERCETDGYYAKTLPTALLSDAPDLPLSICRLVCLASGGIAGVGAAYGSENTDAYRSMLFCAAVDKQWFASLIGLEIGEDDWPIVGLSIEFIADRGPGESGRLAPNKGDVVLPNRSMTPSYNPQSKGTAEASHPRSMVETGSPSYVQSSLSALALFKREVLRAIADNDSSDASSRLTPEMVADRVPANPHAIHRWLEKRGRSDAMTMSREAAIRKFLRPVTFVLNAQGLWLMSMRFDSAQLKASGVREYVCRGQTLELPGFVLPLCVRTTWLDIGDRLVEVQGQLALRDDDEQTYMSLQELEGYHAGLRAIRQEHREHAPAAQSSAEIIFKSQTGSDWNAGKRKSGRPPSRMARRKHGIPGPSRGKRRR